MSHDVLDAFQSRTGARYHITDLKTAQRDAERHAAAARRAVRLRGDMLAIVSHDLRNPVGAVSLAGELLLDRFGHDSVGRNQLEIICRSARRMERLVADLLDMACSARLSILVLRCCASEVSSSFVPASG